MTTFYQNLNRHLTGAEEEKLDHLVAKATGNPNAGIGIPPRHESPRLWCENCPDYLALQLLDALNRMGVLS